jgi:hypothetical protein|tara:strand:- start:14 stop:415 length:402 start_codon:yes stop_codon:yes gene_type:complete
MSQFWICNSSHTREKFLQQAKKVMEDNPFVVWDVTFGKRRTSKQNNALHVFCRLVAVELNNKGYSVESFFKEGVEIPFSAEIVKEHIWKPIQKGVTDKESSADLTTIEIQETYENVNRALSNKGVHIPWPQRD